MLRTPQCQPLSHPRRGNGSRTPPPCSDGVTCACVPTSHPTPSPAAALTEALEAEKAKVMLNTGACPPSPVLIPW